MTHKKVYLYISISILSICLGCATAQKSELLGVCKELKVPQRIWKGREEAFVGRILLTSLDQNTIAWKRKEIVGTLAAGTRVKIAKIIKDWSGSDGHFLRVQVEILDGPFRGQMAEVPSIAPYHPSPSWILEHTLNPDALRFNWEIIKNCDS